MNCYKYLRNRDAKLRRKKLKLFVTSELIGTICRRNKFIKAILFLIYTLFFWFTNLIQLMGVFGSNAQKVVFISQYFD